MTTSPKNFFDNWNYWGLPAFAEIFAPWQNKLTQLNLISEYFQPQLNVGASVLGPLACMIGFALLHNKAKKRIQRTALSSFFVCALLIVACITATQTIGVIVHPGPSVQVVVWIAWILAYLTVFCAFGLSMVAGALSMR